jgi:spermidine/putrescine transport system permease protein
MAVAVADPPAFAPGREARVERRHRSAPETRLAIRRWLPVLPTGAIWLGLFLAPLSYFFVVSFWSVKARMMRPDFTLQNYVETWVDYGGSVLDTLAIAAAIACLTVLLGFGFAYLIRFRAGRLGPPLVFLTLVTLFGGYLVKIYAWKSILGRDGIINHALIALGLTAEPIEAFIYNPGAVVVTLTYFLLPFAVLPIYGALRAVEPAAIEAARDLGARPRQVVLHIVIPQCEAGIVTAFTLAFLISAGDYVTPRFVGGGTAMMGHFIENQFSFGFDWPMGAAMSFSMLAASLAVVLAFRALLRCCLPRRAAST